MVTKLEKAQGILEKVQELSRFTYNEDGSAPADVLVFLGLAFSLAEERYKNLCGDTKCDEESEVYAAVMHHVQDNVLPALIEQDRLRIYEVDPYELDVARELYLQENTTSSRDEGED